jgi:hypothetical protein
MLKFKHLLKFIGVIPQFTIVQLGGGSGSSTTTPTLTPEQTDLLKAQTEAFKNTFLPSYQTATKGAGDVYNASQPYLNNAALAGFQTSQNVQNSFLTPGATALSDASKNLTNLTSPTYFNQLLSGALGSVADINREALNTNNAQYGGTGELGSARSYLANANTSSINNARTAAAVSNALSNFTGQAISGASSLGTLGQGAVNTALDAGKNAVTFANAPTDLYSKYASILYGTPQTATPNFAGTQGSTTSGSGTKFGFSA